MENVSITKKNSLNELIKNFSDQVIILYIGKIDDWFIKMNQLTEILPQHELHYAQTIKSAKKKASFLSTRFILRIILAHLLQCDPKILCFSKSMNGKPFLLFPHSNIQFNISHSDIHFSIIFIRHHQIGIDIENFNKKRNFNQIAGRFFSSAENQYLKNISDRNQIQKYFYIFWTLKEAYCKTVDTGVLNITKKCFYFYLNKQEKHNYMITDNQFFMNNFIDTQKFTISLCCLLQNQLHNFKNKKIIYYLDEK